STTEPLGYTRVQEYTWSRQVGFVTRVAFMPSADAISVSTSFSHTILADFDGNAPAGSYVTGVFPVVARGVPEGPELPHAPSANRIASITGRITRRRIESQASDRPGRGNLGAAVGPVDVKE